MSYVRRCSTRWACSRYSTTLPGNQPTNQTNNQSSNQPANQPTIKQTNNATNKPTNQTSKQANRQTDKHRHTITHTKCWMASGTCLLSIEDTSAMCWIFGCFSHRLFGSPPVVCLRITIVATPLVYLPSRKSLPSICRQSRCEQHQRQSLAVQRFDEDLCMRLSPAPLPCTRDL